MSQNKTCHAILKGAGAVDISEDITELIKQLLKLYKGLTERYRERVNWLEEDRDDNSFNPNHITVPRLNDAKEKHKFAANPF